MERFSERDMDLWRKWMDGETVYARGKYEDHEQQGSVRQGIARGHHSWMSSASHYLKLGVDMHTILEEAPSSFHRVGVKVVRDLGKAAHNHYVCYVFFANVFNDLPVDKGFEYCLDDIALQIMRPSPDSRLEDRFKRLDPDIVTEDVAAFRAMQILQDEGSIKTLQELLLVQTGRLHSGFIIAANEWGWPEPGINSTHDATLWNLVS